MMRKQLLWLAIAIFLCVAASTRAQMGMNLFTKPNIEDIFKPVVGRGGVYEMQNASKKDEAPRTMEMSIVAKDTFEGQDAFWFEVSRNDDKTGQPSYAKMLVTRDFQCHKMVFQRPGQQAMEMPFNPSANDKSKQHRNEELEKWHQVGTESITVPAGTFSCAHWQKDDGKGDVWVSDKVSPFGMVKMVGERETMTLTKVISDAKDHITGPVKVFDPQAMRQQMMDKYQRPQNR
jgi:hypothetical protein